MIFNKLLTFLKGFIFFICLLDVGKLKFVCIEFIIQQRNNGRKTKNVVVLKTERLWIILRPEDKKANMWHGRENGCGLWPPAFFHSSDYSFCSTIILYVLTYIQHTLNQMTCYDVAQHLKMMF